MAFFPYLYAEVVNMYANINSPTTKDNSNFMQNQLHKLATSGKNHLRIATVVFLFGFTFLLGAYLSYVYLHDTENTWLYSHYKWQLRTAWIGFLIFYCHSLLFNTSLI